jgi:cation transport ATPase
MLLILIINFLKGPTCETYLLTAVQTEKLHALHRLKTTHPVMNRLRSLIEQRQGRINPESFAQPSAHPSTHQTLRTSPGANRQIPKAQKPEKGRVHLALFALLVVNSVVIAFSFFYTHVGLSLLSTIASMLMGICAVVALVKQHESNLKQSLRTMTWAALGYVCFSFVAGYVVSITLTFKHPEIWQNQWELFKLLSSTSPWESPLLMTVNIIALSGAAFIGIPGLFMLKNPQQAIYKSSALPTKPVLTSTPKRIS